MDNRMEPTSVRCHEQAASPKYDRAWAKFSGLLHPRVDAFTDASSHGF